MTGLKRLSRMGLLKIEKTDYTLSDVNHTKYRNHTYFTYLNLLIPSLFFTVSKILNIEVCL